MSAPKKLRVRGGTVLPFRRRNPNDAPPDKNPLRRLYERGMDRIERENERLRAEALALYEATEAAAKLEPEGSAASTRTLAKLHLLRALRHDLDGDFAAALADAARSLELDPTNVGALTFTAALRTRCREPGALALLDRAAELAPANPGVFLLRGELLAHERDHERALPNFHRALSLDATSKAAHIARAESFGALRRYAEAVASCTAALRLAPNDADILRRRAGYHEKNGDIEAEIRDLNRAIKLRPNDAYWVSARAAAHLRAGRRERALVDYTRAMQLEPDESHFPSARALIHMASGAFEQAIADLTLAIRLQPSSETYYWRRAIAHTARDDLTAALADYDRSVALEADHEPLLAQVRRLLEADGGEDALPDAEEGLAGAPEESELLLSRADAFEHAWEPFTGLEALAKALDVAPEVTKLHLANARRLLERDDDVEAIAALDRALALSPTSIDALRMRAVARMSADDHRGARDDLERIAAILLKDPAVFLRRGAQLYKQGLMAEAVGDLDRAVALDPEDPEAYFFRGRVLLDMAQRDVQLRGMAISDLTRAIRRKPDCARFYVMRGLAHWMRGSDLAAGEDYDRAIELAPEDGEAWFYRAHLRGTLRDAAGSEANLRRSAELRYEKAIAVLAMRPELRWQ
jgi:tetratricopeptide (TPR) repeat protein